MTPGFWAGRRVFVTGHTGFKGSWLCLWLVRAGAHVVGFADGVPTTPSLFEATRLEEEVENVVADVRDAESVQRAMARAEPEIVFHLAAQSLVRRSYREPLLTYQTNVDGTAHVLEAIRATPSVRGAVIVTTDKVYAPAPGVRFREDAALGGSDPYSTSKACAELVTAAYRSSYFSRPDAPAVATARAGNVIGGGDWAEDRLVPDLVAALTQGRAAAIRNPRYVRPWQHVLNPLDGYLRLAELLAGNTEFAGAWNFGPAEQESRSVEWLAARFAADWGRELRVAFPSGDQPPESHSLELDSTAARNGLGWVPCWGLDRGVRATAEWYRDFTLGEDARALTLGQIEAFTGDGAGVSA